MALRRPSLTAKSGEARCRTLQCHLIGGDADVEPGEEVRNLGIGEAAFTKETDLFPEHGECLSDAEPFFVGTGCLAQLACGECNLFRGEAYLIGQGVSG